LELYDDLSLPGKKLTVVGLSNRVGLGLKTVIKLLEKCILMNNLALSAAIVANVIKTSSYRSRIIEMYILCTQ
jgi:hypothetical protein